MTDLTAQLPGRLSNPDATLASDERAHPKIVDMISLMGDFGGGVEPLGANASYAECLDYCLAFEQANAVAHPQLLAAMPAFANVDSSQVTITGVDDNAIELFIHKPKHSNGPVPCVVHTHGGGMVLMSATDPNFIRLRNAIAATGVVVIGVEFRNGGGRLGNHPFPAGLNDCASAVKWVYANKQALGISSIVISGESGGGNLAIATTLKAKREDWLEQIDGVYAMCPYISGCYAQPLPELLSLRENDGYMLDCQMMSAMVTVYDPEGNHGSNPLAWPYHASASDLTGLPPHVITVNELDPLRDEGLGYFRKLMAAGVPAEARTIHGTPHAGDQAFPDVVPEIYDATIRAIEGFAKSL